MAFSRLATSSVMKVPTAQLSTAISTAGPSPSPFLASSPIARARTLSGLATPSDSVLRLPYPISRIGYDGVTSTTAAPTGTIRLIALRRRRSPLIRKSPEGQG